MFIIEFCRHHWVLPYLFTDYVCKYCFGCLLWPHNSKQHMNIQRCYFLCFIFLSLWHHCNNKREKCHGGKYIHSLKTISIILNTKARFYFGTAPQAKNSFWKQHKTKWTWSKITICIMQEIYLFIYYPPQSNYCSFIFWQRVTLSSIALSIWHCWMRRGVSGRK